MRRYDGDEPINLGGGSEISIRETAKRVAEGRRLSRGVSSSTRAGRTECSRKALDGGTALSALGWKPDDRLPRFRPGRDLRLVPHP